MDVSGRVESGTETEQRPRATHDYRDIGGRTNHDYRDIEGRVTPGAVTEETESRMPKPKEDDHMDVGGRAMSGTIAEVENVWNTFSR